MIIENNEKQKSKNPLVIGGIVGTLVMIIAFGGFFFLGRGNKAVDPNLGNREQLNAVMNNYLPGYRGEIAAMTVSEFKEAVDEQNTKVEGKQNKYLQTTIPFATRKEIMSYYMGRNDINKLPSYIEDKINKVPEEEINDKTGTNGIDSNLTEKITTIIQIDGEAYKERITKTALRIDEKIVDQAAYNKCQNNSNMGNSEEIKGIDQDSSESGNNNTVIDSTCGIEYIKSEFLGDEFSANILGGIVYGYKDNSLDIMTGLDLKTFRELSPRASWWLDNTKYPYPFYSTITSESKFYNNAIINGYWENIDFEHIQNIIIKENNGGLIDGFYKVVYDVAFQDGETWYNAQIVESDQDLKLYDISIVK